MSASSISSFSDCEHKFAFERLIFDVPKMPNPIELVFGSVIHKAHEEIWNLVIAGKKPKPSIVKYWQMFLDSVFKGKHWIESQSSPPEAIRWLTPREARGSSQNEIDEKIKIKKENYIGSAFLAVSGIYEEAIAPNSFVRTEIEFDFGNKQVSITCSDGQKYRLSGRIDRIHFLEDASYFLLDLKTGWMYRSLQRNKIIRDIQMTLYQYACGIIFGKNPKAIFIQPATFSKEDLKNFGSKTLERIRVPVEVRTDPEHFLNLSNLVFDINQVIELVINRNSYSPDFLANWQPASSWGKMAGFSDNVREGRFLPRIGNWCNFCQFVDLCKESNPEDWAEMQRKVLIQRQNNEPPKLNETMPENNYSAIKREENQLALFELGRPKLPYLRKSDREHKKEMRSNGDFTTEKQFMAAIRKWHKAIPLANGQPCVCRRTKLISIELASHIRELEKGTVTLKQVLEKCPFPECPFKK